MVKLTLRHLLTATVCLVPVPIPVLGKAVNKVTLYDNFIKSSQGNFSKCTSYPLAEVSSPELADYCSIVSPSSVDFNDTAWLAQPKNRPSLLCYSLFMTVWSVCLQNDKKVKEASGR